MCITMFSSFEGHIGGKNSSLITAEAHDQYDASKETNGQYGDCKCHCLPGSFKTIT